jgi:hypothetical protein
MSQGRGQRAGEQYKINGMDVNQRRLDQPQAHIKVSTGIPGFMTQFSSGYMLDGVDVPRVGRDVHGGLFGVGEPGS